MRTYSNQCLGIRNESLVWFVSLILNEIFFLNRASAECIAIYSPCSKLASSQLNRLTAWPRYLQDKEEEMKET